LSRIDAMSLINEDIPISVRFHFVPAIKRAYGMVNKYSYEFDWLNWPVGIDILGVLRRVAVEYELKKLIDRQKLPLKYIIAPNAIDNCRHLVLIAKRCRLTISQIRSPRSIPRKAIYRTNYSLQGRQLQLDFPDEFMDINKKEEEQFYMILTHSYSGPAPEFVSISVPGPYVKEWLEQIDLLSEPHPVYLVEEDTLTEEESLLEFKKEVHEVLKGGKETVS